MTRRVISWTWASIAEASIAPEPPEDALAGPWEVAPESDHVGLRLAGEAPRRTHAAEILSRGVPVGAVEIPPSGGLLVLLRGRLVTAGYPVADFVQRAFTEGHTRCIDGERTLQPRFDRIEMTTRHASQDRALRLVNARGTRPWRGC